MLGSLRSICLALMSLPFSRISSDPPPPRLVYQFPPGALLENIAARSNSSLLLSAISAPVLYTIDPTAPTPDAQIVYTFPNATGLTGLAETYTPDVFAVVAGSWHLNNFTGIPGSFSVWSVDFRSDPPVVNQIAPIPDASALNGLAVVQEPPSIILISDSSQGAVWALDPKTRKASIAIKDDLFVPEGPFPLGINGINTRKGKRGQTLHFANSAQGIYGIVPISTKGTPTGKPQILANLSIPERYDDFALDSNGAALIATHQNSVYKVSLDGTTTLFSQSSFMLEPTSSIFGRGNAKEESTLYLPTDGHPPCGGQLIAIDDYSALQEAGSTRWASGQQAILSGRRGRNNLIY